MIDPDIFRTLERLRRNDLMALIEQLDNTDIGRSIEAVSGAAGLVASQYQGVIGQIVGLSNTVDQALTQAMTITSRFDWQSLAKALVLPGSFSELLGDSQVRETFSGLGLVPSPSMGYQFVEKVVTLHESGCSNDEILELVLNYFDEDDSARLSDIVERLESIDALSGWADVLHDALRAHQMRLDAIASYPLVAMIEGVLISAFYPLAANPKQDLRHLKLADYLLDIPMMYVTNVKIETLMCLVSYMEDSLYRSSNWWDDENTRKQSTELNRHRLLHGMAERGTRLNTLRCFLMLDVIGELVPGIRQFVAARSVSGSDAVHRDE